MRRLKRQFNKIIATSCNFKFVNDMMHRSIQVFNEKCQTCMIDLSIISEDCLSIILCPRDRQRLISLTLLKEMMCVMTAEESQRKSKTKKSRNMCAASKATNFHKLT
jgi:hypothetical protein